MPRGPVNFADLNANPRLSISLIGRTLIPAGHVTTPANKKGDLRVRNRYAELILRGHVTFPHVYLRA